MILNNIVAHKKRELEETKANQSLEEVRRKLQDVPLPRDFYGAFNSTDRKVTGETRIIAELKKASPSKGLICPSFDPLKIGQIYAENGASALSVLTESRFFKGDLGFLQKLKNKLALPLLRKDFHL